MSQFSIRQQPSRLSLPDLDGGRVKAICGRHHSSRYNPIASTVGLVILTMLLSGSLFSVTPVIVLYPNRGTTINGIPVYASVRLAAGDRVQTTTDAGKVTVDSAEVELAPRSIIEIEAALILNRGSILVRSGTVAVSNGGSITSLMTGQSARAALPDGGALPEAPSATRCDSKPASSPPSRQRGRHAGAIPTAGSRVLIPSGSDQSIRAKIQDIVPEYGYEPVMQESRLSEKDAAPSITLPLSRSATASH